MICIKATTIARAHSLPGPPARQFDRVEQVLEPQTDLGVALDQQPALEEQRVGVGAACRQQQVIGGTGGEGDVDRCIPPERLEAPAPDAGGDPAAGVADGDAEAPAVELGKAVAAEDPGRRDRQRQRGRDRRGIRRQARDDRAHQPRQDECRRRASGRGAEPGSGSGGGIGQGGVHAGSAAM